MNEKRYRQRKNEKKLKIKIKRGQPLGKLINNKQFCRLLTEDNFFFVDLEILIKEI
jgi:hypothetical protein